MRDERPRFARPQSAATVATPRVPSRPSRQSALINYAHRLRIARNATACAITMVGRDYIPQVSPPTLSGSIRSLATATRRLRAAQFRGARLAWSSCAARQPAHHRSDAHLGLAGGTPSAAAREERARMMSRSRQLAQVVTPDSWVRDPLPHTRPPRGTR